MDIQLSGINRFFFSSPNSNIVTGVELNRHLDKAHLAKALEIVSVQHPFLKMLPVIDAENEGHLVFDPTYSIVIKEYQATSYEAIAQQELPTVLQLNKQALIHFVLQHQTDRTALLLMTSHALGDGIALNTLLEDIVQVLNGAVLSKGLPPPNLSALAPPVKKSWGKDRFLQLINRRWKKKNMVLTQANIDKAYAQYWPKRKVQLLLEELTVEETRALVQHCKKAPYSVNTLLGTLFLYAQSTLPSNKYLKNFIIPVNLRPYLVKDIGRSMGSYVSSIRFDLPKHTTASVSDYATQLQKKIGDWFQSSAMFDVLTMDQIHPNLIDAANLNKYAVRQDWLIQRLIKHFDLTRINTQFILTNYGVLPPAKEGNYAIKNYIPVLVSSAMTIEKYISIYTFAGQMRIGICYDAHVVATDKMQIYIKRFKTLLLQQINP
ncbi:MAG: hypothetical protein ACRBFS_26980 [Aureispira sp.]